MTIQNKLQAKHLKPETSYRTGEYIDIKQVDQENSYYMTSRPRSVGGCYVYQYVTMKDGDVYELSSMTASMRGIVAQKELANNVLQKEIKKLTQVENIIHY